MDSVALDFFPSLTRSIHKMGFSSSLVLLPILLETRPHALCIPGVQEGAPGRT